MWRHREEGCQGRPGLTQHLSTTVGWCMPSAPCPMPRAAVRLG